MAVPGKFSSPTLIALRRGGRRFFDWWLGELAALVPPKLLRWWRGTSGIVLLSLDGSRAVFSQPTIAGGEELFAAEASERGLSLSAAAIRQRLAAKFGQGYRLLFMLPASQVLQRTIFLPAALAENLRQTLSFELDRYTPFRPDQAYFDYRLINQSGSAGRGVTSLQVDLAVAPRTVVDQTLAKLGSFGLNVGGVVVAEDFQALDSHYRNLLPIASITREPSTRMRQRLVFGVLAAVLLFALLAIPIWQKRTAAIALLEPVAQAKAAARETDARRDELGKLVEEHDLLPNKKWDSHSATRALEEMTKLLPDDTFAMQLDFDGKTVQVLGETASSANMVETIEGSPLFKDVAFKSPLTKIQGSPYDRFQIGAALEGATRPKPATVENKDVTTQSPPVVATPTPPSTAAQSTP